MALTAIARKPLDFFEIARLCPLKFCQDLHTDPNGT
jgi:hypothetical protein